MYDFIYEFILSTKYLSIFLLMFLFPSETVMPLAGYLASFGHLSLVWAVAAGVAGGTAWAVLIYSLARQSSQSAVYDFIDRHGKWLGITHRSAERAGKWFDRYARTTVFVGRFIPGLRTAVSIPAGFRHMSFGSFVWYTALGSAINSTLLAYLGYSARGQFDELRVIIDDISSFVVIGLLLLALLGLLWHRFRKHRKM